MDRQNDEGIIIGYCSYCQHEIKDTDNYVFRNGKYYELDCYEQMQTFVEDDDDYLDKE